MMIINRYNLGNLVDEIGGSSNLDGIIGVLF